MGRFRSLLSVVLLVLVGLLVPVAVVAGWANTTIYDSDEFSDRVVALLDSAAIRHEMATRLTEQLARGGNQQAVNFRPAFELAVEAGIDTDTFRSIFRTAVHRTHQALLAGQSGDSAGLNLSDSIAIITSTLQLPGSAEPGAQGSGGLADSLSDITGRLDDYRFWQWQDITAVFLLGALFGAIAAAAGAIALAKDRRRMINRLGWAILVGGIALVLLVQFVRFLAGRLVSDPGLSAAVKSAIGTGMADLRTVSLWVAGYGVIIIAASSSSTRRYTPREIRARVGGWIERRRASTRGKVALGVLGIIASVSIAAEPSWWVQTAVIAVGMWLGYLAIVELLGVVRERIGATTRAGGRRWLRQGIAVTVVIAVIVGIVSAGVVFTTRRAANRAAAEGRRECNGDAANCDLHLNEALFPGSHNSMSSTLYPGWLFAEQVETIKGQLDAGVRALLIDTHYGIPSASKMPGSGTPVVLTDRAAELTQPTGENFDPSIASRAAQLAARAPAKAGATRQIYLCHNFCEMGAVPFASVLADVKRFIDTHPDEIVMLIIQDATTPADTAAAITRAGLADSAATLVPGQPLPTLGELVDSRKTLLVFAEQGGPGAPPWYQKAYDWFQETPYTFKSTSDFNCQPNRGPATAPLFLVNHWVNASPPDPGKASAANNHDMVADRLERCALERGLVPNVVAVDFAVRGKIAATAADVAEAVIDAARRGASNGAATGPPPSTTTTTAPPTTSTSVPTTETPETIPESSVITTLTGGDPVQLCPAVVTAAPVLSAWAFASITAPPEEQGVADVVYGPAMERVMSGYLAFAPIEVAEKAQPLLARMRAATQVLRQLGLDDAAIAGVADEVTTAVSIPDAPDGITLEKTVATELAGRVGADKFNAATTAFAKSQPDPALVADLGYVPNDVALAAGFDCPEVTIGG